MESLRVIATDSSTVDGINIMNDIEVNLPPSDTVSSLRFSPPTLRECFLVAGSWDGKVYCWQVNQNCDTFLKSIQNINDPVLDVCWSDDGTSIFIASCNNVVKTWDLVTNQTLEVAKHDAPVKTCHWIKGNSYTCLMTGSWDKTIKFWDTRSPNPMMSISLPERCYCSDVIYPMAVVGTADNIILVYSLEYTPMEYKTEKSPLKSQLRAVSIFKDRTGNPVGCAIGGIDGRIAITHVNPLQTNDNFIFKCHRIDDNEGGQNIYPINDIAFHPIHGTMASVGSDGTYSFWDTDKRSRLKMSERLNQSLNKCTFDASGQIFAYSVGYDWSKGHEYCYTNYNKILLRNCYEELKPRKMI